MVKTVHIIPHTHWDREWFFTSSRAKVYMLKDLQDIIMTLKNNPDFRCFILDGQVSLVEDYLKWRPQDRNKIVELVRNNKLIIGPWYTQTDQFIPSAECIVRNLLYGMEYAGKLGGYMNVAYVPDSFGQESSMPQIYQGLGIKRALLWRGFTDDQAPKSEFIWQGEDGSKIKVYRYACGYFIGGLIDETRLDKIMYQEPFKTVVHQATTNHIAFPQGSDMAPIRFDLPAIVEKLNILNKEFNFKISSITEYMDAVDRKKTKLATLKGEYNYGKNMRVHKTNYSSRSDIKKLNTIIQNYLTNILEPVLVLGEQYGLEYPKDTVKDLWKLMFENSAHDSSANCVSDSVNEDIYLRYKQIKDVATSLTDLTLREISTRIKSPTNYPVTITVFNTLLQPRTEVIRTSIYTPYLNFKIKDSDSHIFEYSIENISEVSDEVKGATIQLNPGDKIYKPEKVYKVDVSIELRDIPSMGYKQLYVVPRKSIDELHRLESSSSNEIENEKFIVEVNNEGSLDITDKESGKIYKHQAILEENGDGGDSYNYSPAHNDLICYSTNQTYTVQAKKSPITQILTIKYNFKVPKNLEHRKFKECTSNFPVILKVRLNKNSRVIDFELDIDNRKVDDHRLCIDFDTGVIAKYAIDDIQFGTTKRPFVLKKAMASWKKNPNLWQEKPISINTMQTFTSLSNNNETFAVIPQGVREYENIGKDHQIIRLTVFRTYGRLGKKDLIYRPGRASGDATVATPNAELHKKLKFNFGVYIVNNNFENSSVAEVAKKYNTPLQIYTYAEFLNGRLIFPFNKSRQDLDISQSIILGKGNLILSTIKKSERRVGYIIRLYNPNDTVENEKIIFKNKLKLAELVNLKEEKIKNLAVNKSDNSLKISAVRHSKVVSIYFEF
ncbi:MAG: alpha-mannosidase [Lactobacillus sp.]|uniref:glycoside hydrolase family 38 N-terminal domain-containing protein n=1 Tax=Lactobacillus sp. TaxID=1591 RepID=UPI0023C98533|nr:glycoside hydrolase family 38 C-terminal domain-containing protein [Lactobacillus sp.]MDE7050752.1 alpha-mannosidase [Lactobacillus sp.]